MQTILKVALGTALGIILAAVVLAAAVIGLTGSRPGDEPSPSRVDTAAVAPTVEPSSAPPARSVMRSPSTARRRTKRPRRTSSLTACDANILVKAATTSCAFAQNAFYEYWLSGGGSSIVVWSPALEATLATTCSGIETVTCRTGDGGLARFPGSAVDAYDAQQAERYASSHDLGPTATTSGDAPGESSSTDCDLNYEGECLDPTAYDYDCEGGSGNGPEYAGEVRVVGDDPHELDRDGDGTACDA